MYTWMVREVTMCTHCTLYCTVLYCTVLYTRMRSLVVREVTVWRTEVTARATEVSVLRVDASSSRQLGAAVITITVTTGCCCF